MAKHILSFLQRRHLPQQPLDDKQEEIVIVVVKKMSTGLKAGCLRVCAQPAPSIALMKPGMVLSYSEEVSRNSR